MANGDILSDFGINLLEEEIDDVIFQTNEFLTDATFTGAQGPFWWLLVVSTIPSAYTYSSCCCSMFCDFMFREANLKRDKNGTKPQENKVRNTIELHAPTVGITLSCTKVQICPVKSEQFYLFLSLTNTFSDYCTTRDNTSTFYIPVYPFLNTYMLNNVFTHLVNRLSDCSDSKSDNCTQYLPYHKRHIVISGKLIEVKS